VTDEGRLTVYQGHTHGELFAAGDEMELNNLYGKPEGAELQHRLTDRLMREIMAHAENSPRPTHNA
jgi:hypothetical protein